MLVYEERFEVQRVTGHERLLDCFRNECSERFAERLPIRFAVTAMGPSGYQCEVGVLESIPKGYISSTEPIFAFRRRDVHNTNQFNVVLVVPTGIGADIGGHAGDAGPVARMLAETCDVLVLHPNVVNASDINEMPPNALYVEGSVVSRLLMGTVGLQAVRSNRVLVVIYAHSDEFFVNAAINSVNGARASYGLSCPEVVCLHQPATLRAHYSPSGRAAGIVEDIEILCELLDSRMGQFDAVALSSIIVVPEDYHQGYFDSNGEMVNPWGGVEALLTHALSSVFDVPTAHSPMFESRKIANADPGVVDPRMAAEAVSTTFLQCTLKGLQRSPRIITNVESMKQPSVFSVEDVSCLVIPDGCLGLPTLAALEQGISVIAVRENRNLMRNDLHRLPWAPNQFHLVNNYWEAAGIIASIRAGIDPASVRRPIPMTAVSRVIKGHDSKTLQRPEASLESDQTELETAFAKLKRSPIS